MKQMTWYSRFAKASSRFCGRPIVFAVAVGTILFWLITVPVKEYRKRNASGAEYDDPRVAVGAGRFDAVGARAEA